MSEVNVSLKLLHNSNENILQIWLWFLWHYCSYIKTSLVASRRPLSSGLSAIRFMFLDLTCFVHSRKYSLLSHMYVLLNAECIFLAKSFRLGNLFMLINFYKVFTVWPRGLQIFLSESRISYYQACGGVGTAFPTALLHYSNVTWRFGFFISISTCSGLRELKELFACEGIWAIFDVRIRLQPKSGV